MDLEKEVDVLPATVRASRSPAGIRKPGDSMLSDYSQQEFFTDKEKHGWLNSRHTKNSDVRPALHQTRSETVKLNNLGRLHKKINGLSAVVRYLAYILPVALMIAAPIIIYAIFKPNEMFTNTGVRVYLFWLWIEVVWLTFWASKLVSKALPRIFFMFCGAISNDTRRYAAILYALDTQLSLVFWATVSFVSFAGLMSPGINSQNYRKHWIVVVDRLLGACLISTLLYLAERFFIHLISINYHYRSFENRIEENKRNICLLSLLYEASRSLYPVKCQEFYQEDKIISSFSGKISKNKISRRGSSTPLRLIGEIGRIGDLVSSAVGNFASEITGKQTFSRSSAENVVSEALRKVRTSEALAKRLWMSFVEEDHEFLCANDICEVFGPARQKEANDCFALLDTDSNGDVSLDEMIMKVVEIGRDRKMISASVQDVGQAIGVLNQVFGSIISVIIIFVFVAFQNTSFLTTLATAGTALLSLSFVFASTAQEFLGSCIFLFVKHPYDVGDHCEINNISLQVHQISLFFTIFKRIDNLKIIQIPNSVLNTLWIENTTRSKAMKEQIELFISFDTPLEDIEVFRTLIEAFVQQPENSRDYQPNVLIETVSVNSMDKLSIRVEVVHKSNWHNENVRVARHNKLMTTLIMALQNVPILGPGGHKYTLGSPANPTYTVSITNDWAIHTRENADKERQNKRLVNSLSKNEEKKGDEALKIPTYDSKAPMEQNKRRSADKKADIASKNDEMISNFNSLFPQNSQRQALMKRELTRGKRKPGEAVQDRPQNINSPIPAKVAATPIISSQILDGQSLDEEN